MSPLVWGGFIAGVLALIVLDLGLSRRRHRVMSPRTALWWSALWVGISLAFALVVWRLSGGERAQELVTGYLLEKALSVDNLFVFMIIFGHFRVPPGEQHRVLTWGIVGALGLRAGMIVGGMELIRAYHFVIYVFGGFLALTGVRMLLSHDEPAPEEVERRLSVRVLRRLIPLVPRYEGGRFFTRENGRRVGTLLLLVLLIVELSDIVFAFDSIPAIFAVTDEPFIVFSSNMLAVLGLRALYFVIEAWLRRLRYLRYGLSAILLLIGGKMCLHDVLHLPPAISLVATLGILAITVVASLVGGGGRETAKPPQTPKNAREKFSPEL